MLTLNGKELSTWYDGDNVVVFKLLNLTLSDAWDWAKTLSGEDLVISQDGTERQRYGGYDVTSVGIDGDSRIVMRCLRALDPDTEAAITALEANVATAQATADSAMETAQAAGTEPAVKAASVMYVNASTTLTNTEVADVRDLVDDFKAGGEYAKGAIRRYEGAYYRMAQDINSTTSTTYQPGEGTESLYTLIDLAADGIRVWHMPTDATNSFALGEKAHHPGEDGPVYTSQRNGNTSEPGTDEWWVLDQEEAE